MKSRKIIVLFSAVGLLGLSGCNTNMLRKDAIEPAIKLVSDRHDAYVTKDATLSATEKETYLMTTELLRQTLNEAK